MRKCYYYTAVLLFTLSGCSAMVDQPGFNPKTCMERSLPGVPGLHILRGERTERNIIADMQAAYCNGQVLLKLMHAEGEPVKAGTVVFRIVVEYNGEVISARVVESDIESEKFVRRLSDIIMDLDFTPWQRHDEDTEFTYPLTFDFWWK